MKTAPPDHLSVDELATEAGVSVRTVRYYQSEGLLPGPERHGREARYQVEHLERLRLIDELQRRGLRLTAISDLLRGGSAEAPAEDWLGLGQALMRPWTEDHPAVLEDHELASRLRALPPDTAAALERTGLIERRTDTTPVVCFVPSPGLLDVAVELVRLGVDLETAADLRRLLQDRLRSMAEELVESFTERVSLGRLAAGGPGDLARLLDALQPLTERSVQLLFAHEMERAQRRILASADDADDVVQAETDDR